MQFTSHASRPDEESEVNQTIKKISESNRALTYDVKRILENKQRLENENFMLAKEIDRLRQVNVKFNKPITNKNKASNLVLDPYEEGQNGNSRSTQAIRRINMD